MQIAAGRLISSPTDLASFLACRHKTGLDRRVALGELTKPSSDDPLAEVLQRRGQAHEDRHVASLVAQGLRVVNLRPAVEALRAEHGGDARGRRQATLALTVAAMRDGADAIVQAPLGNDRWFGYADVLRKVARPSVLGAWSYEAHDTKLSRETRGGTILQLCVYTELVGEIQGVVPEFFQVITPAAQEPYRFDEFAAFYRSVTTRFLAAIDAAAGAAHDAPGTGMAHTVPPPVDHCDICRWWPRCNAERRAADHLSFVAGLGRVQQDELESRGIPTLAALARLGTPLAFRPTRGARETYEKLREQARLQLDARTAARPIYEMLPPESIEPETSPTNVGLARLPAPSAGDLFLDLEGDQFAERRPSTGSGQGREYLFGLWRSELDASDAPGTATAAYTARWAFTDAEEHAAFNAVMDDIMAALAAHPDMHVYHYGAYEPAAFKRAMGRYASRESDVDLLLRGGRFVDLFGVVKHALRAGVESYSIKSMEPLYGFSREVDLKIAGEARRIVEFALETNDPGGITTDVRAAIEGYNRDDCRSTLDLRRWLEARRDDVIAGGIDVPRPVTKGGEASEKITDRQRRVERLRPRVLAGVPADPAARTPGEHAQYLLAYLLDFHRRENKAGWWDYFRLVELDEDDLLDERKAIAGLRFAGRVADVRHKTSRKPTGSVIDRYTYPPQEMDIRAGADLKTQDGRRFGSVESVDRDAMAVEIKKGKGLLDRHPTALFEHTFISSDVPEDAIARIADCVADAGSIDTSDLRLARRLLCRQPPASLAGASGDPGPKTDLAVRLVQSLDADVLAMQGPPGSGKTYSGAKMICALAASGKKVGVTGHSHKVIRNLLTAVEAEAARQRLEVRMVHKHKESDDAGADVTSDGIEDVASDAEVISRLASGTAQVAGGTVWLWSSALFTSPANQVDVLFVDEAGQMALANVLAASQAARSLVLLGDPQQLDQPLKGTHPDGTAVSALHHILGEHQTMPADRGILLPITWRLSPAICAFTSEVFYENKLTAKPGLERQELIGFRRPDGRVSGLRVMPVTHDDNRNASDEEVRVVASLVQELLAPASRWIDERGDAHPLTPEDILIVAPYNAQVARLQDQLRDDGAGRVRVGTVDKFQGQEAPVVIYSMATSRPEDAPRGMEFLYSLHRLNVATSRARCACVLVASPRLFEPDCRTPRQMQLANALCRFVEMAEGNRT